MSHRPSATAGFLTPTPIRVGAERFARQCAIEPAPWLAGNKAAASSGPADHHGQSQRLTATTWSAPASAQNIAIVVSDQAAQLQSP